MRFRFIQIRRKYLLFVVICVSLLQMIFRGSFLGLNWTSTESLPSKKLQIQLRVNDIPQKSVLKKHCHNDDPIDSKLLYRLNYKNGSENVVRRNEDGKSIGMQESKENNTISSKQNLWSTEYAIIERTKDCYKYFELYLM